jgi:hypothetical protein
VICSVFVEQKCDDFLLKRKKQTERSHQRRQRPQGVTLTPSRSLDAIFEYLGRDLIERKETCVKKCNTKTGVYV